MRQSHMRHSQSGAWVMGRYLHGASAMAEKTFALGALAQQLALAAQGFALFAGSFFGRLFIEIAQFHFAKHALALQLFLESAQRLIDIIVPDMYEQFGSSFHLANVQAKIFNPLWADADIAAPAMRVNPNYS
jgi:hypothetical protein